MSEIHKWTTEESDFLKQWFPHFGSIWVSEKLGIDNKKVKSKINSLKLKTLPKKERLCVLCKINYQESRSKGIKCSECHSIYRSENRNSYGNTIEQWIKYATTVVNYRARRDGNPTDLTSDFMQDLWNKQEGKCFYSNLIMVKPEKGVIRNELSASIDRIDSNQTYSIENVVWCCWGCNCGKGEMTVEEYYLLCKAVADNHNITEQEVNSV